MPQKCHKRQRQRPEEARVWRQGQEEVKVKEAARREVTCKKEVGLKRSDKETRQGAKEAIRVKEETREPCREILEE